MTPPRVTEAEIIDVLMGDADPVLEARVREAVRTDLKAAACYAEWTRTLLLVREGAGPAKEMSGRVVDGVMGRIRSAEVAEARAGRRDPLAGRPGNLAVSFLGAESADGDRAVTLSLIGRVIDWFPRSRAEARVRKNVLVPVAAALAVVVALGGLGAISIPWWLNSARFESVSGGVYLVASGDAESADVAAQGSRVRFPFDLRVDPGGKAVVRLPGGNRMSIEEPASLTVDASQQVRQTAGAVHYRIDQWRKEDPFTVRIPQGTVVDLGTEFTVDVDSKKGSVIRVQTGRVRVMPRTGGGSVGAVAGDRVLVNDRQAVVESAVPVARARSESVPATGTKESTPGKPLRIPYRPVKRMLASDSHLSSFISGASIPLTTGAVPPQVKKLPPFTSSSPHLGVLETRVNDRDIEAVVACDRKLSGKWRVYFDGNLNGDLTDDVSFTEGEDFVAGRPFRAGTINENHAVYLRLPIRISHTGESPTAEVARDRIDFLNYNYLAGDVAIPSDPDSKGEPVQQQFLLLDSNSNGNYFENVGALAVWTNGRSDEPPQAVRALGPFGSSTVNLGFRWALERDLSGSLFLVGERLDSLMKRKALSVGDAFPPLVVKTLTGEEEKLAAPAEGYLLVYVWSTWCSSGLRDAPLEFNDLAPKFGNRGLKMVGISVDYQRQDLTTYLDTKKIAYPQVYNGPNLWEGVTAELGITQVPLAILVDGSGAVVSAGQSADWMWTFLDANLPPARGNDAGR